MTTTITVKTHSWPVAVTASEDHSYSDDRVASHGYRSTTTFVPKESEQTFNVSQTSQLSIRELPQEATGLNSEIEKGACDAAAVPL